MAPKSTSGPCELLGPQTGAWPPSLPTGPPYQRACQCLLRMCERVGAGLPRSWPPLPVLPRLLGPHPNALRCGGEKATACAPRAPILGSWVPPLPAPVLRTFLSPAASPIKLLLGAWPCCLWDLVLLVFCLLHMALASAHGPATRPLPSAHALPFAFCLLPAAHPHWPPFLRLSHLCAWRWLLPWPGMLVPSSPNGCSRPHSYFHPGSHCRDPLYVPCRGSPALLTPLTSPLAPATACHSPVCKWTPCLSPSGKGHFWNS